MSQLDIPSIEQAFIDSEYTIQPQGSGILNGLHFAVKDVFAIEGHRSSAGNPDWLRTHEPATQTAKVLQQLLDQGATLKGITHTDELMFSLNGQNEHYGTPLNPAAPDRIPGGSSSGSASAVASKQVDFAIGTDTGGSVRIPAAYCGIYGFRPTHHAVTVEGLITLARSFDTVGWMSSSLEVMSSVGQILLPPSDSSVSHSFHRLLFPVEAWELIDESYRELLQNKIADWKIEHLTQADVQIAPEGLSSWMNTFRTIQGLEIWQEHHEWIEDVEPLFGKSIGERFQWASTLSATDEPVQRQLRQDIIERIDTLLGTDGLLVIPTAIGPAPFREISGVADEQRRYQTMQLSCIAGLGGLPQLQLPAGFIDGAPVGISLIARSGKDLELLRWSCDHLGRSCMA